MTARTAARPLQTPGGGGGRGEVREEAGEGGGVVDLYASLYPTGQVARHGLSEGGGERVSAEACMRAV